MTLYVHNVAGVRPFGPSESLPWLERITGPNAVEVTGFIPTAFELQRLARYWETVKLDICLDRFFVGDRRMSDDLVSCYAGHRLELLRNALGESVVENEQAEAHTKTALDLGQERWSNFARGDWQEVQRQQTVARCRLNAKLEDKGVVERAFLFLKEHPGQVFLDDSQHLWRFRESFDPADPEKRSRLVLHLTNPEGWACDIGACTMERPEGWVPPYRFGLLE